MKTRFVVVLSIAMLTVAMGCGLVDSLVGNVTGTSNAGTVTDLWPDVPRMDGLTKTNIGLPLPAQLAIKAMTQGDFQFIIYTTNGSPQDVVNFYTADRMTSAGWNAQDTGGCNASTDSSSGAGGICAFQQDSGGKQNVLLIITAQDSSSKQTQVIYARIYNPATPTPAK